MTLLLLPLVAPALAEDPTFAGAAAKAAAEKPETHLSANFGGTLTAGNAESLAINAGLTADHKWEKNEVGAVGGAAVGFGAVDANADGFLSGSERCLGVPSRPCSDTAERYSLDLRYDRFISERSSLYVLVGGFHDKFAGFALRAHGQLGFAQHLVDTETTRLKVEVGADFANESYVEGVEPASARLLAAQVAANFSHQFNEGVGFTDVLTAYEPVFTQPEGSPFAPHFTDVRVSNVATLNSKMTDKLSISVSDTLAWRNEPVAAPAGIDETRAKLDNTTTITLVASLL
jgi:putative salt-induced outer membrane protein YdiY